MRRGTRKAVGHEVTKLTMKTALKALAYWQKRLRVQDWDVELIICRYTGLDRDHMGECEINNFKRQAQIRLTCLEDLLPVDAINKKTVMDWELTLVHELLHLHLHDVVPRGMKEDDPKLLAMERAVDQISRALVNR